MCEMLMLDEISVRRLLKKFADILPQTIGEIRTAIDEGDLMVVHMLGHKLKGTAGNFRIDALSKIGSKINKIQNIQIESPEILSELEKCAEQLIKEVYALDI